jgi:hypothetical protein
MPTDQDLTARARAAIVGMGFHPDVAACVEVETLPGLDGRDQCSVSWGYQAMRRGRMGRSEVGVSVFPASRFDERLADRDSVADMYLAVRAMLPSTVRDVPPPAWTEGRVDRIRGALSRAARLSAREARDADRAAA